MEGPTRPPYNKEPYIYNNYTIAINTNPSDGSDPEEKFEFSFCN